VGKPLTSYIVLSQEGNHRPQSYDGIPSNSRRSSTQRALHLYGMAYGLDPINDQSVDMTAAAHERGWEPVEADAEDVNSYANPVELPATPVGR
jgi:hypothetical protein